MANRYDELISKFPRGSFYDSVGNIIPYRGSQPYELLFSPVTASRTFGVFVNGKFQGEVTSDANGRALVTVILEQGRQDIVLIDKETQTQFPAFVDVRVSATAAAAHADVFNSIDVSIDDIQSAMSLETASSRFIEDIYGRQVRQPNDLGGWLTDTYRRLLRRLRQAFRVYAAKLLGVRQTVSAFTSALPLRVPRLWRANWVLGQQLMGNGDLQAHTRLTASALTNLNLTGTGRAQAYVHAAFGGVPTIFPGPFASPAVFTGATISAPDLSGNQLLIHTNQNSNFTSALVGQNIEIAGAVNSVNNGTFPVVEVLAPNKLRYLNAVGVDEPGFSGTYTIRAFAQPLTVTFSAAWNGGSVVVTGTDALANSIVETLAPTGGPLPETVVGLLGFATVTGATKGAGAAGTASIGLATSRFLSVVEFGGGNDPVVRSLEYLTGPDRLRWATSGPTVAIPTSGRYTMRDVDIQAQWFSLVFEPGGGFVVGDEHFLALELDGKGVVIIDLANASFAGGPSPRTAAQVATSINRYLRRDTRYGAVKATGTITCIDAALINPGETVTIGDGVSPNDSAPVAVVFRFRKSSTDGLGVVLRTDIDLVDSTPSASSVAGITRTAINGLGGDFRVTAGFTGNPSVVVTLENDFGGTQGNIVITDTVANVGFIVSGMSGGVNGGYDNTATALLSLNSLGTVIRFLRLSAGPVGPSSTFRVHPWGADAARTVLGEPRFASLLQSNAAARAVLLDAPPAARLNDTFEAVILHDAILDTAGTVTTAFTPPTRPSALEVYFDGGWRGGTLHVFGTEGGTDAAIHEQFIPPSQTVDSGLRAVSFNGTDILLGGRGDSFSFAAGVVTLTDADGAFTAAMTGGKVTIENATSPGNNGTFSPVTFISATQISYPNVSGVTEAFSGVYGLDRGELFNGVTEGMFFRRTDNGTGAFIRINDLATVGNDTDSYRVRLHASIAGAPWGPVAWTVTRDALVKGTKCFKTLTQMLPLTTPGAGTAGSATLSVIDGASRGYKLRVGRNIRDQGAGGATFAITPLDDTGKTALFIDSAASPAFLSELTDLQGFVLIQGATADGGANNGLHRIYSLGSLPLPGSGFLFLQHQDHDRGGCFAVETLPGGASWRIYNRGEVVTVVGRNTTNGDLTLYPPGLSMARPAGDLLELADAMPFEERGFEGPGRITVDVDRTMLPTGAASDALTLSGTVVPDGWRALNDVGGASVAPGFFGPKRHFLLGNSIDADGIGAKQAFQRELPRDVVLGYRGFTFRASFWVQQHTSASENLRIDFSFDGTTFSSGTAVPGGPANPQALAGTFLSGLGSDGVRDPVLCQAQADVPYNATTCVVRLVHVGAPAIPPPFHIVSVEKCTVVAYPVTPTFLGTSTIPYGEHRAKFGELLYVWSPESLGTAERTALGVPTPPASVPTTEGQVDRIVNAHGYWERFDVTEYSGSPATAVNLKGTYDEIAWLAATLTNMEMVVGTPPRVTVVRPTKVSLIKAERLTVVAPSNATLAETSAHEGPFPEAAFSEERLYENGLPVPSSPSVTGGVLPWRFLAPAPSNTLQIASVAAGDPGSQAVFNSGAIYTLDYRRLIRAEPPAFDLGATFADYLWLIDAVLYRRAEVSSVSYRRTQQLIFLANLHATLSARSDQNTTTSSLVRDTGLARSTVPVASWRYVDGVTVEIDSDVFDPNSIYTFEYNALEPKYGRPATAVIETRSSSVSIGDVSSQTWRTVVVDEVVNRAHRFHQLRVTISGVVGGRIQNGSATGVVVDDLVSLTTGTFVPGIRAGMVFRVLSGSSVGKTGHVVAATSTSLRLDTSLGSLSGIDWEIVSSPGSDIEVAGLGLRGIHLYGAGAVAPGIIV